MSIPRITEILETGVQIAAGTALLGKVGIDQVTANANVVVLQTNAGKSTASFTRPNDTTAYAAGDVVGTAAANLTFANVLPNVQNFIITGMTMRIDSAAVPAGMGGFKVDIYSAANTVIADNAARNLVAADRSNFLGTISLATPVDMGDTLFSQNDNINFNGKLVTTNLYAVLSTDNIYTPVAETVYTVTIYTIGV